MKKVWVGLDTAVETQQVFNVRGKCLGRVQGDRSTGLSISQGDGYHHWSFMALSQGD